MLRSPLLLLLLCLPLWAAAPARAQDDGEVDLDAAEEPPQIFEDWSDEELFQRVLLVPFLGETGESTGIGDLLEGFLASKLENSPQFEVFLLDEVPAVESVEARLYYEGCPAGDELGCQFVIGESARVDRVVSGRVTVQSDDRYRVVVTILGVNTAEVEFTYALDLSVGEEALLPRTVELSLDRLRREELLEPLRTAEERAERRRRSVERTRTLEERELIARMELDVDDDVLERYEQERRARQRTRITTQDLAEQKGVEGVTPEWEEMGLTERQFLSYRNSHLSLDDWRTRYAGHRLMLLVSGHAGFAGGATGLRYYGGYLLNDNLSTVIDSYAWQRSTAGTSPNFGLSVGFGILRNLNIEVGFFYARSKVYAKVSSGASLPCAADEDCRWKPDPDNRPTGDWTEQALDTFGGDVMLRYSVLVMSIVRPTVGLGAYWQLYPSLYNDPEIPDEVEQPSITSRFETFPRLVDGGPQIEVGVAFDFNRNVGIFLRAPVAFFVNPNRVRTSVNPPSVITDAPAVEKAPFGVVRVLLGVQGRIGGKPIVVKRADDLEEIDLE